MKWEIIPREEQETIINVDYCDKTIGIYTNRKAVADRLEKKMGKPSKIYGDNELIFAVEYTRNLYDKDIKKFFSKSLIIGNFKEYTKDEE